MTAESESGGPFPLEAVLLVLRSQGLAQLNSQQGM